MRVRSPEEINYSVEKFRLELVQIIANLIALAGFSAGASYISGDMRNHLASVLRRAEAAARRLIYVIAIDLKCPARKTKAMPFRLKRLFARRVDREAETVQFALFDPCKIFHFSNENEAFDGKGSCPSNGPNRVDYDGFAAATQIERRLIAIEAALKDLPKQAKRMARKIARRKSKPRKLDNRRGDSPLRLGIAPGQKRKCRTEVDYVLLETCYLVLEKEP